MFERQGALFSLGACLLALAKSDHSLITSATQAQEWADIVITIHTKSGWVFAVLLVFLCNIIYSII